VAEGAHGEKRKVDRNAAHERDWPCMSFATAGMVDDAERGGHFAK
jgi:hypothetical protein